MIGKKKFNLTTFKEDEVARDMDLFLDQVQDESDNKVDARRAFGTVSPASADTTFSLFHNLGHIPTRFLQVSTDKAGHLYKSDVAWTKSIAYFKHSGSSVAIEVNIW